MALEVPCNCTIRKSFNSQVSPQEISDKKNNYGLFHANEAKHLPTMGSW